MRFSNSCLRCENDEMQAEPPAPQKRDQHFGIGWGRRFRLPIGRLTIEPMASARSSD